MSSFSRLSIDSARKELPYPCLVALVRHFPLKLRTSLAARVPSIRKLERRLAYTFENLEFDKRRDGTVNVVLEGNNWRMESCDAFIDFYLARPGTIIRNLELSDFFPFRPEHTFKIINITIKIVRPTPARPTNLFAGSNRQFDTIILNLAYFPSIFVSQLQETQSKKVKINWLIAGVPFLGEFRGLDTVQTDALEVETVFLREHVPFVSESMKKWQISECRAFSSECLDEEHIHALFTRFIDFVKELKKTGERLDIASFYLLSFRPCVLRRLVEESRFNETILELGGEMMRDGETYEIPINDERKILISRSALRGQDMHGRENVQYGRRKAEDGREKSTEDGIPCIPESTRNTESSTVFHAFRLTLLLLPSTPDASPIGASFSVCIFAWTTMSKTLFTSTFLLNIFSNCNHQSLTIILSTKFRLI